MKRLDHLLVILMEECAEVQKEAAKALRFGLHPDNVLRLNNELNDLVAMVEMVTDEGVDLAPCDLKIRRKREKVEKFLMFSREVGTLED